MNRTTREILVLATVAALARADDCRGDGLSNDSRTGNPRSGPEGTPAAALANINNISAWYNCNGEQERDPTTGNSGLYYPRGMAAAIYSGGIFWGGKFKDGLTPVLRVNGQQYNDGTRPGRILGIRTGLAEDPSAPDVHIWKIRRDYATADLTLEAAEFFSIGVGSVTQSHIDQIRQTYARDWQEWPWEKGAPFYDLNGNGMKDPGEDPGLAGADQVLWYVCNDIGATQPWTCPTSGIEQQTTIWAYNRPGALSGIIFKRFRLFFKGVAATSPTARIDTMYVAQWSDPDLGAYWDDFAGCDTGRNLGFCYNANPVDARYAEFGLVPPAISSALLQGPMVHTGFLTDTAVFNFRKVPGAKNLPMTAFIYFAAGGMYQDPPYNYTGAIQWYQMLRGFPPTPTGPPDPPRFVDPVTGQPTSFWLNGDPVTRTGWCDGSIDPPGDRRSMLASGPFTLALGDSQEFIVATAAGIGYSHINSITKLRVNVDTAKRFLDSLSGIITAIKVEVGGIRHSFELGQNYPNPFNPTTTLWFSVPKSCHVSLKVYDLLGREIATLVDEERTVGRHEIRWDAELFATGVYFYQLRVDGFVETKQLMIVR